MIQIRWKRKPHGPNTATFRYLTSTADAEWNGYEIETPDGITVNVQRRTTADGDLAGATVISITTNDATPAHPNGEPRMQVALNDVTLYDRENAVVPSRDEFWRTLCEWYRIDPDDAGIAGLRTKPATHCHRYVGVVHDMPAAAADPAAHLDTFETFEEACDRLGSAVIDGYLPEAVYDLDTGQRTDLHIDSPIVAPADDQIGANPLQTHAAARHRRPIHA